MSETQSATKTSPGVGMPQQLYLHEFGSKVWEAFGSPPYLVGSVLTSKAWRDVDIRLMLADNDYDAMFPDAKTENAQHLSGKWVAYCMAWSALGEKMTGLPIDFQIQRTSDANDNYKGVRSMIGRVPLRYQRD